MAIGVHEPARQLGGAGGEGHVGGGRRGDGEAGLDDGLVAVGDHHQVVGARIGCLDLVRAVREAHAPRDLLRVGLGHEHHHGAFHGLAPCVGNGAGEPVLLVEGDCEVGAPAFGQRRGGGAAVIVLAVGFDAVVAGGQVLEGDHAAGVGGLHPEHDGALGQLLEQPHAGALGTARWIGDRHLDGAVACGHVQLDLLPGGHGDAGVWGERGRHVLGLGIGQEIEGAAAHQVDVVSSVFVRGRGDHQATAVVEGHQCPFDGRAVGRPKHPADPGGRRQREVGRHLGAVEHRLGDLDGLGAGGPVRRQAHDHGALADVLEAVAAVGGRPRVLDIPASVSGRHEDPWHRQAADGIGHGARDGRAGLDGECDAGDLVARGHGDAREGAHAVGQVADREGVGAGRQVLDLEIAIGVGVGARDCLVAVQDDEHGVFERDAADLGDDGAADGGRPRQVDGGQVVRLAVHHRHAFERGEEVAVADEGQAVSACGQAGEAVGEVAHLSGEELACVGAAGRSGGDGQHLVGRAARFEFHAAHDGALGHHHEVLVDPLVGHGQVGVPRAGVAVGLGNDAVGARRERPEQVVALVIGRGGEHGGAIGVHELHAGATDAYAGLAVVGSAGDLPARLQVEHHVGERLAVGHGHGAAACDECAVEGQLVGARRHALEDERAVVERAGGEDLGGVEIVGVDDLAGNINVEAGGRAHAADRCAHSGPGLAEFEPQRVLGPAGVSARGRPEGGVEREHPQVVARRGADLGDELVEDERELVVRDVVGRNRFADLAPHRLPVEGLLEVGDGTADREVVDGAGVARPDEESDGLVLARQEDAGGAVAAGGAQQVHAAPVVGA